MADPSSHPQDSGIILYQTEDGRTRIECRFEGETLWLSQALMAELFQIGVNTVNHHLSELYAEGELDPAATIRQYRIVRTEGTRQVAREIEHYSLPAIIAVGYRVRSHRGTQFRQWATARLSEFLVKGFTMDDERLKNPPGPGQRDYFEQLLERIRDIRAPGHSLACHATSRPASFIGHAACRDVAGLVVADRDIVERAAPPVLRVDRLNSSMFRYVLEKRTRCR
jgi:hypothetical protein